MPAWPAEVAVRLFEAVPGTRFGHLSLDDEDIPEAGEFGELTPRTAGMLLGRAALGSLGQLLPSQSRDPPP